jgi:Rrf2 family protein
MAMAVSQKCQYALRALFELAKRWGGQPAKIGDIASTQSIPPRFLEVILNELKQGGFTDSRRGKEGGYFLARPPEEISVGDVIRFVQGPLFPVDESALFNGKNPQPDTPGVVFITTWKGVERALSDIYDKTSLRNLLEEEERLRAAFVPDYNI